MIRKGDIMSIVDPLLAGHFKIESLWRIAEVAILSLEPHGASRPKMQEVILAIQEAIKIEKRSSKSNNIFSSVSSQLQFSQIRLPSDETDSESLNPSNKCVSPSAR